MTIAPAHGAAEPVRTPVAPVRRRPGAWRGRLTSFLAYAVPTVVIIAVWQLASDIYDIQTLFPSPLATAEKAAMLIEDGSLPRDIAVSMARILVGFVIGSVIGTVIGLVMGMSRTVADLLNPFVNALRYVGSIAWITAVMIWFGIDELSKIILIVYTTMFVVLINTMVGVMTIHRTKIRAAECFGLSRAQMFRFVIFPAALPHILTGARLAMMNSFMTVVSAEMVAAQSGLGYLIFSARQWMETDSIFVGMATLGVLGLLTDRLLALAIRTFLARYEPVI